MKKLISFKEQQFYQKNDIKHSFIDFRKNINNSDCVKIKDVKQWAIKQYNSLLFTLRFW